MSFLDKLKRKADELGLKDKADHLAEEAKKAAAQAKEKAGDLAAENRDRVESALDKAGAKIDEKTEGKYADKITKAKEQVTKGVDKLAEGGSHPHAATAGEAGTAPSGSGADARPTGAAAAGTAAAGTAAAGTAAAGTAAAGTAAAGTAAGSTGSSTGSDQGLGGTIDAGAPEEEEVAEETLSAEVDPEAPLDAPPAAALGVPRPQRAYDEKGEPIDEVDLEPDEPTEPKGSGSW